MRTRTAAVPLLGILLACGVLGCGGSGGGNEETVTLPGTKAREGTVNPTGATVSNTLNFGDNSSNVPIRAVLSFSLATLPANATILSATLEIEQEDTGFGSPFTDLGNLLVDHVDLGSGVDTIDFTGGTLSSGIAVLSTSAGDGLRTADVTSAVLADLASARGRSEFRLRFAVASNNEGAQDTVRVIETGNLSGKADPVLIVRFER